jgi:hypothetical protein
MLAQIFVERTTSQILDSVVKFVDYFETMVCMGAWRLICQHRTKSGEIDNGIHLYPKRRPEKVLVLSNP